MTAENPRVEGSAQGGEMPGFVAYAEARSIEELLELCMQYAVAATHARLDHQTVSEYKHKINIMRGVLLRRSGAWERAAAINSDELTGAKELAFELGADICSDHCDLDPDDQEKMAHCHWCDQATRVYQMLRALAEPPIPSPPTPLKGLTP